MAASLPSGSLVVPCLLLLIPHKASASCRGTLSSVSPPLFTSCVVLCAPCGLPASTCKDAAAFPLMKAPLCSSHTHRFTALASHLTGVLLAFVLMTTDGATEGSRKGCCHGSESQELRARCWPSCFLLEPQDRSCWTAPSLASGVASRSWFCGLEMDYSLPPSAAF